MTTIHLFSLKSQRDDLLWVTGTSHYVMMATINSTVVFMVALKVCVRLCVCAPDVRSGVDSGVSRRTLWNTGPIVDDVFEAARLPVLVQLLSLRTLVVEVLDSKTTKTHMYHMCLHQCMQFTVCTCVLNIIQVKLKNSSYYQPGRMRS